MSGIRTALPYCWAHGTHTPSLGTHIHVPSSVKPEPPEPVPRSPSVQPGCLPHRLCSSGLGAWEIRLLLCRLGARMTLKRRNADGPS